MGPGGSAVSFHHSIPDRRSPTIPIIDHQMYKTGLAFRGHDESLKSSNRSNYIELVQFLAYHNEKVKKVVFENAPKNLKYTSSDIQKDLVHACAIETINASTKDMEGEAIEKFLGVQHVSCTMSSLLEETIERLFATTNLSRSTLQEQGYNGASNMRGELNGLKTKILNKYPQAFYIHCFAHQLQLALIFVAKENEDVANFFINASSLVNLIGSSSKRHDAFREKQQEQIQKALDLGNLEMGKGLNQESSLMYPCDTLWNLHYGIIVSIIVMFEVVVEVVEWIKSDSNQDNLDEATSEFPSLRGISDLAKELVKTGRCESYMLVYKLLILALVLPAATASVERAFSAMKIVKTPLRNKMGDQWLSDSMVVYIKRYIFSFIKNEPII
ncbi:zinc finger MYM-type protein 1-like [Pyrus x bretschneideri]|uniref:zinc finger MYM-type protein 1-like n=1 Tax=Pyrus x bretschneideri TaxID=225117 RepID=UPI002030FC24|nr:zinc finger MYM-type protein 1-like [Pyrus x bretschneideri]